MTPFALAACVLGTLLAIVVLVAAAAAARNPALVMIAAILVVWGAMMIINGSVVQTRFDAALAANGSDSVTVVAYQEGLSFLVAGDSLFQGFCDLNVRLTLNRAHLLIFSFASNACVAIELFVKTRSQGSKFEGDNMLRQRIRTALYLFLGVGIPAILTGVDTALRPTRAYYVNSSYCDQDSSRPLYIVLYIVVPALYSSVAAAATVLSLRAYSRKRREIIDAIASSLLERRYNANAQIGVTVDVATPMTPYDAAYYSSHTGEDGGRSGLPARSGSRPPSQPAALLSLLHFIQRMAAWCVGFTILTVGYEVLSLYGALAPPRPGATAAPEGYLGTSLENSIVTLYEPPVLSILLFLCFGLGTSARASYVALGRKIGLLSMDRQLGSRRGSSNAAESPLGHDPQDYIAPKPSLVSTYPPPLASTLAPAPSPGSPPGTDLLPPFSPVLAHFPAAGTGITAVERTQSPPTQLRRPISGRISHGFTYPPLMAPNSVAATGSGGSIGSSASTTPVVNAGAAMTATRGYGQTGVLPRAASPALASPSGRFGSYF
ncbi:hypothetical protein HK405_003721 [Cladochytrium tenue]|nr:hypothetical protein HK405_003721 [Cladochytrium tenue]